MELLDSGVDREFMLEMILTIKTIDFCVKWFHMMKRVKIGCFLFILKAFKNNLKLGIIIVLS